MLGEPYTEQVWVMENTGDNDYDALNLSLEKRYSNNWSGRISYSLSKSRGTAENQADKNTFQFLTDLNLDALEGPSSVDRRHILSINGRTEIPKNRRRDGVGDAALHERLAVHDLSTATSTPIATASSNDPSPAGTYSGTQPGAALMTDVEERRRTQRRDRARLLPGRCARRLAPPDQGDHAARAVPRHLQHHQPRQLR